MGVERKSHISFKLCFMNFKPDLNKLKGRGLVSINSETVVVTFSVLILKKVYALFGV